MTEEQFKYWYDQLKYIWESRKPEEIVEIVADEFAYYESPFEKPYTTKEDLVNDWRGILNQENIKVDYQILAIQNNLGIAAWQASYEKVESKEKVELSGIFAVKLSSEGKCTEFRMWYNTK
jgi:hypothetical protein